VKEVKIRGKGRGENKMKSNQLGDKGRRFPNKSAGKGVKLV